MWSTLYVIVLTIFLYRSFFFSSLHLYILLTVVYGLYYVMTGTPSSHTGVRQSTWLRSLSLWSWCKQHYFIHCIHSIYTKEYQQRARAYLFLTLYAKGKAHVHQWADFSTFAPKNALLQQQPLVCLHWVLFKLPYLTDVLQWFGCISLDRVSVLSDFINRNASIVIPLTENDNEDADNYKKSLRRVLTDIALSGGGGGGANISIVPVLHQEISPLYNTIGSNWRILSGIRRYTLEKTGLPLPIFSFGWFGTCFPRKRGEIHTYLGKPIDPKSQEFNGSLDSIETAFFEEVGRMNLTIDSEIDNFEILVSQ